MTISATSTSQQFVCNGVATQFSYSNKIFQATDLVVTLIDTQGNLYLFSNFANIALGLSYTVQNVDVDSGCLVNFNSAPTNNWTLDIRSAIPNLQSTSIKNQGPFLPELHEEAFDKLTRFVQDLSRKAYTFGIHAQDIEVVLWPAMPLPAARKGMALMFDASTGLPTTGVPTTQTITQGTLTTLLYPSSGVGVGNTGAGYQALISNGTGGTPGNNNTAFGYQALKALSGGVSNPTGSTAIGYLALALSNGATNTAVGDNTMASDLTGTDNQAFGAQALFSETTATGNNCFGFQCGYYITTGNSNLLIGNYAGGGPNGPGAGVGLTTGGNNVGVGGGTLANLGTGSFNTAIGLGALLNNVNGNSNVAVGYFAGTHANSASEFYLDNQDRGSNANEIANALIYGNFGASASVNRLRFNAQLTASVGTLCSPLAAPTIASASGIVPTAAITFVSGTTTVTAITQPSWMNNGGRITLIPTGVWAWNTTGNIALAGTAVVGKALDFIWDGGTGKWYPSYVA